MATAQWRGGRDNDDNAFWIRCRLAPGTRIHRRPVAGARIRHRLDSGRGGEVAATRRWGEGRGCGGSTPPSPGDGNYSATRRSRWQRRRLLDPTPARHGHVDPLPSSLREGREGGGDEEVRGGEGRGWARLLPLPVTTVAQRRGEELLAATRRWSGGSTPPSTSPAMTATRRANNVLATRGGGGCGAPTHLPPFLLDPSAGGGYEWWRRFFFVRLNYFRRRAARLPIKIIYFHRSLFTCGPFPGLRKLFLAAWENDFPISVLQHELVQRSGFPWNWRSAERNQSLNAIYQILCSKRLNSYCKKKKNLKSENFQKKFFHLFLIKNAINAFLFYFFEFIFWIFL
jgi:hypothetical protein